MNYNINDIELYMQYFNYKGNFGEHEADDFEEKLFNNLKEDSFRCSSGCTKFVIIPKEQDYVIKIPFNGNYMYDYDEEETFFSPFENGGGENYDDYLALEEITTEELKEKEEEEKFLSNFFLPVEQVGEYYGHKIYIQPKARCFTHIREEKQIWKNFAPIAKSVQHVREVSSKTGIYLSLPNDWIASCYQVLYENDEKLIKLLNFLCLFSDLHDANIGYYNNHPVVIDYAGYYDN